MFNKQKDDETSVWISNTDLMSGLLVLFLFISIIMTQNLSAANQRFKNVTQKSIQFKQELKNNIDKNFSSQEIHQYHLDQADGSASFDQAVVALPPALPN